jgi:hypothetical protein
MPSTAARLASARVVLAAGHPDPARFRRAVAAADGLADWPWIVERAERHKVVALLARRVGEAGSGVALPADVRKRLETAQAAAAIRAAQCQRTFSIVAETLNAASVPFLLVKGGVLAEHVYREPSVRPFYDIDVLLREEHLDAGDRAMRSAGFRPHRVSVRFLRDAGLRAAGNPTDRLDPETTYHAYRRFHFHWRYFDDQDRSLVPVEVHWHLFRPQGRRVGAEALWEDTRVLDVAGRPVRTLGLYQTIVHLCTHALVDYPYLFRVLHLADVAWVVDRWAAELDAAQLHATAARWGTLADVTIALAAARDLLGADAVAPFAPFLTPWQRFLLARAASERSVVELSNPRDRWAHVGEAVRRRALWDLARHRWSFPGFRATRARVAGWIALWRRGA